MVGPIRKGIAGRSDDCDQGLRVVSEAQHRLAETRKNIGINTVPRLRAIERDRRDLTLSFV